MDKFELVQHIPGEHVHTFLFTDDVKLTMSDIKPNKYGEMRAKVEAWSGDKHACASSVTLGDPESRAKFIYYASQRVNSVDWYEAFRLAADAAERYCNDRAGQDPKRDWRPEVVTMSDIEEEAIEWLWWPYIAVGKVCMLDGDPGIGKSLNTVQVASTLSVGGFLPDQQGQPTIGTGEPFDTLMLALEDGLADTLKTRIRLCGGNDRRIHVMTGWRDGQDEQHAFTLQDMPKLEAAIQQYRPRLVVIDPIQAYLGKINMNQANEVQPLMAALAKVAETYGCAIVCVRHPAKPGQGIGKVIHRGIGSIAFMGGVRTGIFVEQHPLDKDRVLLCQSKNNIGTKGRTQVFSKAEGAFSWCGVSRLDAELLGGSGRGPDSHAFIGAACWLEEHMKPGIPMPSKDIEAQMYEAGYSKDMIQRAKRALGIKSTKAGEGWIWTLPILSPVCPPTTTSVPSTTTITSPPSTTSVPSSKSNTYVGDRQDVGEMEETEAMEDTEVTGVVSDPTTDLAVDTYERAIPFPKKPNAPAKPVDVDKPLAATAKLSRKKASGHNKDPLPFGNWTVKNSPPRDEPLPRADTMGEQSTNGVDGHEDLEVF